MTKQKKNNHSDIASVPREAIAAVGARRPGSPSMIFIPKAHNYACVFIVGLDWLEPGRWTERQINKIAYVAITRARQRLFIPYCFKNSLIQRILEGL